MLGQVREKEIAKIEVLVASNRGWWWKCAQPTAFHADSAEVENSLMENRHIQSVEKIGDFLIAPIFIIPRQIWLSKDI
ncbi:MAG: hypothetical protein M0036_25400 [Desulfobacteraceae bacterium]|nr:hypothetical protein [Desulfobacteraceae bacterium]